MIGDLRKAAAEALQVLEDNAPLVEDLLVDLQKLDYPYGTAVMLATYLYGQDRERQKLERLRENSLVFPPDCPICRHNCAVVVTKGGYECSECNRKWN